MQCISNRVRPYGSHIECSLCAYRNGSGRVRIVGRKFETLVASVISGGERVALHVSQMRDLQDVLECRHLLGAHVLLQAELQTHEAQPELEASARVPELLLCRLCLFSCCQQLRSKDYK